MDKLLEFLGIAAGLGVVYLVVENNMTAIKHITSNIIPPSISNIIPGHEQIVYHGAPPPGVTPKGVCKPGRYLDQTDGILTCVDPHGIKELPNPGKQNTQYLNPNPRIPYPDEGVAYGDPITPETYPSQIKSSINDKIDAQKKRQEDKEKKKKHKDKKLAQIPDTEVHTQVECPSDISKSKCDSNCYKDGKLWKIVCSESERQKLYPSKKKTTTPSLVIPPNFPSQVTVTPSSPPPLTPGGIANPIEEAPYPTTDENGEPTDQEQVGGTDTSPSAIPSLDLTPGQQSIKPTIPVTAPTHIAPAPQLQPIGAPFHPFTIWKGFASADANGCRQTAGFKTCRRVASDATMRSRIGNNGYRIDAVLDIGEHDGGRNQEASITSAGPGSDPNMCCGFTVRINLDKGSMRLENEDWAHNYDGKHRTSSMKYWEGDSISGGKPVYGNKGVQLSWIAQKGLDGSVTYHGEGYMPGGKKVVTPSLKNPAAYHGASTPLTLFNTISGGKTIDDAHRVRVDCAKTVNFNNPTVTVLKAGGYYSDDWGYIDDEDFLI